MGTKFRWIENKLTRPTLLLTCLVLAVVASTFAALGTPLSNEESDGYLQWLHSLEQTVAGREATGAAPGHLLFPFDQPGWDETEHKPYRHLAISKAIMELEAQWLLRGGKKEESALVALAHARNYTHLSEYDSAMVWYAAAAQLDTMQLFTVEIGQERLATTIAAGDSTGVAQLVTNTLGEGDLEGRERQIILVYRWLVTNRDQDGLELLIKKLEGQPALLKDEILFWHAYAESWLGKREAALGHLRTLIKGGGLSQGLTEGQRAWVLVAIPDLMFLKGQGVEARPLYQALSGSTLIRVQAWAHYQLANLAFLEHGFETAANSFGLACDAPRQGSWQDQACSMAELARELQRIKTQGEPYGTDQFYQP